MSVENETMGELIADWRKGRPVTADQIHTAWVREREALLKRARDNYAEGFAKGREAAPAAMGNVAALREVVERVVKALSGKMADAPAAMTSHEVAILNQCRAALSAPPRNCDRFGGDYKMLHTAWSNWTASPSGRNPNNTMKMTFSEWLVAPAAEKEGGNDADK